MGVVRFRNSPHESAAPPHPSQCSSPLQTPIQKTLNKIYLFEIYNEKS